MQLKIYNERERRWKEIKGEERTLRVGDPL
jgi:hypothetical protein